ncbi:saccharopine dehydrogenase family protein [Myroides marinus]|uniref:saccharopine dehydrogenase family protein n=1 Tax=Myroides marinus TaxID=703342 RepID=UPI0025766E86|nr:saccharopine dehydrogenase C-terminal domain-containing protein [Myroides marinus]MDM1360051.1 saccharopine dehydrogenase NADP-binding domain-containing protein [Myroides marinus]
MTKEILIVGAGRSSSSLIKYLLDKSKEENLHLTIGDLSLESAQQKAMNHPNATPIAFDLFNESERQALVQKADIVVSMLPAILHVELAKDCVRYKKHMVTASYISPAMQELNEEVTANNLIFMNEIGLDPGIDHMSAMKIIHDIKNKGGKVISFESFCGGLIAPESDTNLWNYKFTWNPRNVVLAGQGGAAKFLQEGQYKYIPYNKVFRRTEFLNVDGYEKFEAYANRDSLKYKDIYGLDDARTIFRGTIRRVGYSRAWNLFVELGITDDSYKIDNSKEMTYREFINSYLPYHPTDTVETKLRLALGIDQDDIMWDKLLELDLFNPTKKIGLKQATPAQILEKILSDSWTLDPDDKDMIVMYHRIGYELHGEKKQIDSRMVCLGDNQVYTAMAKTVGLPVAIATLKILKGIITTPGVQMPITEDVYEPILKELENYGINFVEDEVPYSGFN